MLQITFQVEGLPPAKNEASSLFAQRHPHAGRALTLLSAAKRAIEMAQWETTTVPLALDVILVAPTAAVLSDCTNYLGGIADVLEVKAHRTGIDHIGDLREVALYTNDRQLCDVRFRRQSGAPVRYSVTLRTLNDESQAVAVSLGMNDT
jgi:hypothetical protein